MGKRMVEIFDDANRLGGLRARIRLTGIARSTAPQARVEEDSAENVATLELALRQVIAEQKGRPAPTRTPPQVIRAYVAVIEDLTATLALPGLTRAGALGRLTEAAARTLEVERASLWTLSSSPRRITCVDLYDRRLREHSSGPEHFAKDFPAYFDALGAERTIAAHDAHVDPRTAALSMPYLRPLRIDAVLDVPFWQGGELAGLVRGEHTDNPRVWQPEEEDFAYQLGGLAALVLARR